MTDRVEIAGAAISAVLMIVVIELVRRRKLTEEYSLLWIFAALGLFGLSFSRTFLHRAAAWLGIYYPPAILLLALVGSVFAALLYFSVVVSRQRQQIERLIEEVGLLSAEVRDLQKETGGPKGPPDFLHVRPSSDPYRPRQ
jgi:hypothetical protein